MEKTVIIGFVILNFGFTLGNNVAPRIIGGDIATAGQFPFMAAIYKETALGKYFFGGALLNNEWIITSGSCVDGATLFTIVLGAHNIKVNDSNVQTVATDRYVLHPNYNSSTLQNDIGLIQLRMPITFTDYIKPFSLLAPYELPTSAGGVVGMGWGQTSDDSAGISDDLYFAYVIPLSNDECKLTFGNQIVDTMVCAVGRFNEGSCYGDTGSPLIRFSKHLTLHMGVASFISANGCETADPSGYTRSFDYVDWIKNVTNYDE